MRNLFEQEMVNRCLMYCSEEEKVFGLFHILRYQGHGKYYVNRQYVKNGECFCCSERFRNFIEEEDLEIISSFSI